MMKNKPSSCISTKNSHFAAVVSPQAKRSVQALSVFLRAVASFRDIGQEFVLRSTLCHLTGNFGQQIQLRLQKLDFQRDLSCEHEVYLSQAQTVSSLSYSFKRCI